MQIRSHTAAGALLAATCLAASAATAASCLVASPVHRIAVLELYTSEGCNSCPPADRWLSHLDSRGFDAGKVVLLAFHVDYWNQLGWSDRFSEPRFSDRQRAIADRRRASVIYTPQFVLNGRDWRAAQRDESLATALATINGQPARAQIRVHLAREPGALRVLGEVAVTDNQARSGAEAWIALFENDLSTDVRSGENGGKRLHHDFVVRELVGPLRVPAAGALSMDQRLTWRADLKPERTGVAIFVQRRDDGEVLQAVASPLTCAS